MTFGYSAMLTLIFLSKIICYMPGPWNSAFVARNGSPAAIRVTSLPREASHRLQGSPPGPLDGVPRGVWNFPPRDMAIFDDRSSCDHSGGVLLLPESECEEFWWCALAIRILATVVDHSWQQYEHPKCAPPHPKQLAPTSTSS